MRSRSAALLGDRPLEIAEPVAAALDVEHVAVVQQPIEDRGGEDLVAGYVGGNFTKIGGQLRRSIAAIDVVTGTAAGWNPGADGPGFPTVHTLEAYGPAVYVGGDFEGIGGEPQAHFAALSLTVNVDVPVKSTQPRITLIGLPNPASGHAALRFLLPTAGYVSLTVFDIAGRRIATIARNELLGAGVHERLLAPGFLGAGAYFARLEFGGARVTKKLVIR